MTTFMNASRQTGYVRESMASATPVYRDPPKRVDVDFGIFQRHRAAVPATAAVGKERMGRSVEIIAIILFGVFGLSHILQKAWAEFFISLRGKREAGACLVVLAALIGYGVYAG
jgi:hypothetical protein